MAKRNLTLFKKTTVEPEVIEEEEMDAPDQGMDVDDLLGDEPPDYSEAKPLSANEAKRLADLEDVITHAVKNFYDLGCALREIQQRRLYRTTHETFADYCKEMWEVARSRAYQMIDAVQVVDYIKEVSQNLSTIVDKTRAIPQWVPRNEGQARVLLPFKDDPVAIRNIVAEAVQTAPDGKMTASHLKKTAKRLHLEKVADTIQKRQRQVNSAPKISEDFRRAFNAFLDAINIERANEYKHTDQKEVIRHVTIILEALEAEL
ncbi:MAG: hypothetical protein HY835_10405 [Anaerolineae bacterium]|nr:hypothetical protein [Anaerolineae bacterium]